MADAVRPLDDAHAARRLTPPITPDGRYIVVRGRLWRRAKPHLPAAEREAQVAALMRARRAVRDADTPEAMVSARAAVHAAKVALGERGPVWWGDDENLDRYLARNTRYAEWYASLDGEP